MPALVRRTRKVSTRLRAATSAQRRNRDVCASGSLDILGLASLGGFVPRRTGCVARPQRKASLLGRPNGKPRSLECTASRGNANVRKAAAGNNPPRPFVKQNRRAALRIKNIAARLPSAIASRKAAAAAGRPGDCPRVDRRRP